MKADLPATVIATEGAATAPATARAVGLRYVSDDRPGLGRKKRGEGFDYVDADGERISDAVSRDAGYKLGRLLCGKER